MVSGLQARVINIDNLFDTNVWAPSGATTWDAGNEQLILTGVTNFTHGRVFTQEAFDIEEFTVEFEMKIGGGSGADGVVFGWVTDYGYDPEPANGGRIDFLPVRGYGVEFDCYYNAEYNDANGQHIAVIKNGVEEHLHRVDMAYGAIEDNQWHTVKIYSRRGHVRVWWDGDRIINHQIPNFPHDQFNAHFGFTSATGALNNWHIIRNIELTVIGNNEPQPDDAITITAPNGGEILTPGDNITIDWNFEGGIDHFDVFYSIDGGVTWLPIGTTTWEETELDWVVPHGYSTEMLIKVVGLDEEDNVLAFDVSDGFFAVGPIELHSPRFYAGWWLVSVPLNHPNPTKENVIGDDIPGIWDWYQFSYDVGYWRPDDAVTGPGYWLAIAHDEHIVDVQGTANFDTVRHNLRKSWNIIGCPFPVPVPLSSILFRYNGATYTASSATDENLIVPMFTGCTPPTGHFQTTTLNPWFGYWFMSLKTGVEMLIPPPNGMEFPVRDAAGVDPAEYWEVGIQATSALGIDKIAKIGACEAAKDGFDSRWDIPRPAPRGNYVMVYNERNDFINSISRYAADIRAMPNGTTISYNLFVQTSEPTDVTLSWPNLLDNTTAEFTFMIEDLTTGESYNMAQVKELVVAVGAEPLPFVVTVTTPQLSVRNEIAPVVVTSDLISAYPNPFNPQTTIGYTTTVASDLTVAVYDLSGKVVATLANGFKPAGSYSVNWNAVNLSNGVYVVRMQGNGFSASKKVVLMK